MVGDHVLRLVVFIGVFVVPDCCDHGDSRYGSISCGMHDLLVFNKDVDMIASLKKQNHCFIQESSCKYMLHILC